MLKNSFVVAEELSKIRKWDSWQNPISREERMARVGRARILMEENGMDALLVVGPSSMNYYCGVNWQATERLVGLLITLQGEKIAICPKFEVGSLEAELKISTDIYEWEEDENPFHLIADVLGKRGLQKLGVDPEISFGFIARMRASCPNMVILNGAPVIDGCRMQKSGTELALLQQAKLMTLEVHKHTKNILKPSITRSEVMTFIDEAHRALGASGVNFSLVLFGEASAYPHGVPGEQVLSEGDVILIDMGCAIEGYQSDITRTYVCGKPSSHLSQVWAVEKEAQAAAFEAARLGSACEEVDFAARRVLEKAGFGPDYKLPGLPHRTGHGIGLSIHEPAYLVKGDRTVLDVGMCFSIEPTIAVPGAFGVRLEDHFFMTANGPEWFTRPQHSLEQPFEE